MSALRAGLFGKLPAHGDFVHRGWSDATGAALDGWLSDGMAGLRETLDTDAFGDRMRAAAAWQAYLPGGMAGDDALHIALTPSIDRAGRLFFLAAGIAGTAPAVWRHLTAAPGFAERLDAAVYAALAGTLDADALVVLLDDAIDGADGIVAADVPARSCWWSSAAPLAEPAITASSLDRSLFDRLLSGEA